VTRTRADRSRERAAQATSIAEVQKTAEGIAASLPQLRQALEEVAEDNMALLRAVRCVGDDQQMLRSDLCRELDRLRSDVEGELLSAGLRQHCRELSPVLGALERMLAYADLSDTATMRAHLQSLLLMLESALRRMGIERQSIEVGQDRFDSLVHECVHACSAADSPIPEAARGVIVFVQEPGYLVQGRVAQPAKVWVQQGQREAVRQTEEDTACDTTKS
jgi:molecular chaperone GrpE (heat shock protein)